MSSIIYIVWKNIFSPPFRQALRGMGSKPCYMKQSKDPRKYWSVMKTRLMKTNPELTTKCSQLKLKANDGRENGGYGSHRDTEEMEAAGQARLAQRGNL